MGLTHAVDAGGNLHPLLVDASGNLLVGGMSIAHVLLDGSVHPDTLASTPVRGGIIRANSTPKWEQLALGAVNKVLYSDGSDINWLDLANVIKAAILTVNGDILYRNAAGNVVRLPMGTALQGLRVNVGATDLEYATVTGGYTQGARAYNNADQNSSSGVWLTVALNSEYWDTDTIHDLVTHNERLTCNTAGVYMVAGCVAWPSNATGVRALLINSSSGYTVVENRFTAVNGEATITSAASILKMAVNEYVYLQAYQTSGGVLALVYYAGLSPVLTMERIG